mmetsp:Transcript_97118/g.253019  ORF Transcript_97118/g.253019 Transcript_97118/m.253019 type:complete len:483 (+) Transcript_97118:369-1817(+)
MYVHHTIHFATIHDHPQLMRGDLTIAVQVEDPESSPTDVLLNILPLLDGGGQELCVIDHATAICINTFHYLLQILRQLREARLREPFLQLGKSKQSIPVAIKRQEGLPEALDLNFVQLGGNHVQNSLRKLATTPEPAQLGNEVAGQGYVGGLRRAVPDPGVVQSLLCVEAVLGVHLHQHADELLRILGDAAPVPRSEIQMSLLHLCEYLLVRLPEKRRHPREQDVHDHASRPQIAEVVVPSSEHLRRDVVRGPRPAGHQPAVGELAGEAEVDELQDVARHRVLALEQKIFWFQVPVTDMLPMKVEDCPKHLLHHDRCILLVEVACLNDAVEKLPSRAQLHSKIYIVMVLERLEQLNDIWVIHDFHDCNLPLEPLDMSHLGLRHGLDGADDAGRLVDALAHRPIGPLTESLLLHVVHVLDPSGIVQNELCLSKSPVLHFLQVIRGHPYSRARTVGGLGSTAAHFCRGSATACGHGLAAMSRLA